jgi:hypothetical protein
VCVEDPNHRPYLYYDGGCLTNGAGAASLYYMDETALSFYVGKWDRRTEDIYLLRRQGGDRLVRRSSLPIWFSAARFRDWLKSFGHLSKGRPPTFVPTLPIFARRLPSTTAVTSHQRDFSECSTGLARHDRGGVQHHRCSARIE